MSFVGIVWRLSEYKTQRNTLIFCFIEFLIALTLNTRFFNRGKNLFK